MKRLSLLAVLALALSTTGAAVAGDDTTAAASTPSVAVASADLIAALPTLLVAEPEPLFKAACTASIICICGGSDIPLSCTGQTSCSEGVRHVKCDGMRYNCPPITSCPH